MAASEGWSRDIGNSRPPAPRWEEGPARGQEGARRAPLRRWVEDAQLWARASPASSTEPGTAGTWGPGKVGPEGQSRPLRP